MIVELRIRAASEFDYTITMAVNYFANRSRILDHIIQALAAFDLFQGLTLVALAFGAFAACESGRARVRLAIGIAAAAAAAILSRLLQLLMPGLSRPIIDPMLPFRRPSGGDADWVRDWRLFPSDRATLVWGLAIATLVVNWRIGALSVVVALLSSLARMYCGLHYATDILGGLLLAAAVVCASLLAAAPFEGRLLEFARRRPALLASVGFLFCAQAATMFAEVRVIAGTASRNVREIIASRSTAAAENSPASTSSR